MIEDARQRSLLLRANAAGSGEIARLEPNAADWRYISFRAMRLAEGDTLSGTTAACETALVVIEGAVHVRSSEGTWREIGGRADPFSGPPAALMLPPGADYRIEALCGAEIAICGAVTRERRRARLVAPAAGAEYARGQGEAERIIRNIVMGDDEAAALFLVEVVTPPGHWSSYPPHKHDEDDPPRESALEEIYYYRTKPAAGFAFQRVYTASGDLDQTITAHDRDVVMVPRGYHACAAAPGYWIYYLNVLAGPKHRYRMSFDPEHAWIKESWTW